MEDVAGFPFYFRTATTKTSKNQLITALFGTLTSAKITANLPVNPAQTEAPGTPAWTDWPRSAPGYRVITIGWAVGAAIPAALTARGN